MADQVAQQQPEQEQEQQQEENGTDDNRSDTVGTDLSNMNQITTLEYSTVKVPYEQFNKHFRIAQKSIEKHNHRVREVGQLIVKLTRGEENSKPDRRVSSLKPKVKLLIDRMNHLMGAYDQALADEMVAGHQMLVRTNHLVEGEAQEGIKQQMWRNQRISRFIIEHLLRSGFFETAQKLSEQSNVEETCNKSVYMIARQVEDSLMHHETDRCLEWVADNKSKLRRLKSTLEVNVRLQDCIELVKKGERLKAIHYARRFLMAIPKEQWTDEVVKVMGLIGFGVPTKSRAYADFFNEDRWYSLVEEFQMENARLFKLMECTPFNACLCLGLSGNKTTHCRPDPNSRCVTCQPEIYEIAEDLPHSHVSNSRLVCAYSGERLTEQNQPMMLPNGYVYGQKSIDALRTTSGDVVCPRTGEVYPCDQLQRVYIM